LSAATWIEAALPDAKAIFSTRLGGVSRPPFSSLNLGILTDDDPGLVQRNRDLLATALGRDAAGFAMGLQVHGSSVQLHARRPERSAYSLRGAGLVESDAQLTTSPDVTPMVLVADCFPLVLSAPGAVAVVHCGWRGVAAGIVSAALDGLGSDTSRGDVTAVIGPGIGPCCYEVGDEVRASFEVRQLDEAFEGRRLDLRRAIRSELEREGVQATTDVGLCTSCNPGLFFSHRRDGGRTGRQAGIAWLEA
jgi:polyphenol oxidase